MDNHVIYLLLSAVAIYMAMKATITKSKKNLEKAIFEKKRLAVGKYNAFTETQSENSEILELKRMLKESKERAQYFETKLKENTDSIDDKYSSPGEVSHVLSRKQLKRPPLDYVSKTRKMPSTVDQEAIRLDDDNTDSMDEDLYNNSREASCSSSPLALKISSSDSENTDSMDENQYNSTREAYHDSSNKKLKSPPSDFVSKTRQIPSRVDYEATRAEDDNSDSMNKDEYNNSREFSHDISPKTLKLPSSDSVSKTRKMPSRVDQEATRLDDENTDSMDDKYSSPGKVSHPSSAKTLKTPSSDSVSKTCKMPSKTSLEATTLKNASRSNKSPSAQENDNQHIEASRRNKKPSFRESNNQHVEESNNSMDDLDKIPRKNSRPALQIGSQKHSSDSDSALEEISIIKRKKKANDLKEKSFKRKNLKVNHKILNDSDSSDDDDNAGSDSYEKYAMVTVTSKSGKKVEKIHLGKGEFIKKDAWEVIKTQCDDSKFVKYLATALWSRQKLVNRCVKSTDNLLILPGRSPRKLLSPRKKKVVEDCFKDHLVENKIEGVDKIIRQRKTGYYLSQHIGSLRRLLYPNKLQKTSKNDNADPGMSDV